MVELNVGRHAIEKRYSLKLYGVTEEYFDELTEEDIRAEFLDGVTYADLRLKRPAYHDSGVQELWFIDLANQAVILDRRRDRRYTTTEHRKGVVASGVLNGFSVEVDWLWAEPMPNGLDCLRAILS
jgi:hypothetical protein